MLSNLSRLMTTSERLELEKANSEGGENPVKGKELMFGCLLTAGSILCAALLFFVVTAQKSLLVVFVASPILVIVGIVLFFLGANMVLGCFRWRGYAKKFRQKTRPKVTEALADGMVSVKQVVATEVIEIEEFEDEGGGWIFDIGEGQCLVLKGQRFFPNDERAAWPNTQFEIVRTAKHNLWVGIFCAGTQLEPSQRIPSAKVPEKLIWDEMETVISGKPADVVRALLAS
jgi:hypothetical protein